MSVSSARRDRAHRRGSQPSRCECNEQRCSPNGTREGAGIEACAAPLVHVADQRSSYSGEPRTWDRFAAMKRSRHGTGAARMRVLLTGHEGYLGAVVARVLRQAGHDLAGLDIGYFTGCDLGPPAPVLPSVGRDVRDVSADAVSGFDAVVHLAALSNDPLGDLAPELTHAINVEGSARLARAARDAGVSRFVFSSSCSIYGTSGGDELVDESAPLRPLTPYAESKVRTEEFLHGLADDDFCPVALRNATVYGFSPRLRTDLVVNDLVASAVLDGEVRVLERRDTMAARRARRGSRPRGPRDARGPRRVGSRPGDQRRQRGPEPSGPELADIVGDAVDARVIVTGERGPDPARTGSTSRSSVGCSRGSRPRGTSVRACASSRTPTVASVSTATPRVIASPGSPVFASSARTWISMPISAGSATRCRGERSARTRAGAARAPARPCCARPRRAAAREQLSGRRRGSRRRGAISAPGRPVHRVLARPALRGRRSVADLRRRVPVLLVGLRLVGRSRRAYAARMVGRSRPRSRSLVVEVASNDGYLLGTSSPAGSRCSAIEPAANVAAVARCERACRPLIEFFGRETGAALVAREGYAPDLVVGNNVLAHVPDLDDFVSGLAALVGDHGLLTMEFPHLAPTARRQPVRHDLPRALLVLLVALGGRRPGSSRRGDRRCRGAADARRVVADPRSRSRGPPGCRTGCGVARA